MCIEKTCPDEVDEAGIQWPLMLAGHIAVHRCPRGMRGWSVSILTAACSRSDLHEEYAFSVVPLVVFQFQFQFQFRILRLHLVTWSSCCTTVSLGKVSAGVSHKSPTSFTLHNVHKCRAVDRDLSGRQIVCCRRSPVVEVEHVTCQLHYIWCAF